jgi:hypothetical protein
MTADRSERPQSPHELARLILEAVAVLHERSYGRLKVHCYVKDGLGAWRHTLFAASSYPIARGFSDLPTPWAHGSLPGSPVAKGLTAVEVADAIERKFPELLDAARGSDSEYELWYRELLAAHPGCVFEIETPNSARPI